jgi:hypothetical protein
MAFDRNVADLTQEQVARVTPGGDALQNARLSEQLAATALAR